MPSGLCLCRKAWNISLALKEKRVATCSGSARGGNRQREIRNPPRVTQLLREEPRFKPRLSSLIHWCYCLWTDASWAKDTTVQPARRARCHRRHECQIHRPGHGRSEGLESTAGPAPLPPFLGKFRGKGGARGLSVVVEDDLGKSVWHFHQAYLGHKAPFLNYTDFAFRAFLAIAWDVSDHHNWRGCYWDLRNGVQ